MALLNDLKRTIFKIIEKKLNTAVSLNLMGMVVVLTGGSRGLGREISINLVSAGCQVINLSRTPSHVPGVLDICCDLKNSSSIDEALEKIRGDFKKIDVLINNAASTNNFSWPNINFNNIQETISVNVSALVYLTSKVSALMVESRSGLILNIGSKISRNPNINSDKILYGVSKYAVEGFSNALRPSLREYGVRVVCLLPGTLNTELSLKSGNFLATEDVCETIQFIISKDNIDFENIVIKGKFQGNVG